MDNSTYRKYLKAFNFSPATYGEIAIHLEKYGVKEMYHARVNEVDIVTVLSIPHFKIFWCCRCHLVAADGSTEDEHWHALVQFEDDHSLTTLMAKVSLRPRTTFKKILCPDQALGVLRNICCKGAKTRRGLVPHTHYARSVFSKSLSHARGRQCTNIRDEIYDAVTSHVSLAWMKENNYLGVSQEKKELHNREICRCRRGKIFKQEREIWRS